MGQVLTADDRERADLLHQLLFNRLQSHIDLRVKDESKRSSWVFDWVVENLSAVAAAAVAFGQIKKDLRVATAQASLLASREGLIVAAINELLAAEGCYLYKDAETGLWVRSGKVVGIGRNFGVRNKEHAHASLLHTAADLASFFYQSYPSASSEVQTGAARRGFFGNLELCVGLGFTRTSRAAVKFLCSSDPAVGMLTWSTSVLDRVGSIGFKGCSTLEEKQLQMVGYLFEIVYDIMISPRDNVSRSPGFKTPLGIFGGSD